MRTGGRCALTRRPQRPADLFSKGMFRARGRGPAGRTYTCRRWRQVRDLIIAQTGGRPLLSACHVSGSEGRRRGDSLRDLFAPQLQSDERNSKNHWFLAAFLQPFAAVGKRLSRRSAKYPFGKRTRSGPSGTPAPTSARRGGAAKETRRSARNIPQWGQIHGRRQKNCKVRQKNIDFSGAVL